MIKLTGPEGAIDREYDRDVATVIRDAGGCKFCKHRIEGWGRVACKTEGRRFPACTRSIGVKFEKDDAVMHGAHEIAEKTRARRKERERLVSILGEDRMRQIERTAAEASYAGS